MKVTNGDVYTARPALQSLCKEPWPVKTAYRLAKLLRKVNDHAAIVEQVRNDLILRYGGKNEQGQPFISSGSEHGETFVQAHNELMAEECEIEAEVIVLPDNDIALTPETLLILDAFVSMD